MAGAVVGWDIGGAHLKAARVENGRIVAARQAACPLWLGVEHLAAAFATFADMIEGAGRHGAAMTGELAEIFPSRADGVRSICEVFERLTSPAPLAVYAGRAGFLSPSEAARRPADAASANWFATAEYAAGKIGDGLLVDIGSTTADFIPFAGGRVAARGYADAERLMTGELLYTGVARTSLMALAALAPFDGALVRVMAENFSTTADLYRITGELRPEADSHPASDGRGKSAGECRARLARMLGRDAGEAVAADWDALARFFRERQIGLLYEAAAQALSGAAAAAGARVVGAGAGEFLAAEIAARLGAAYVSFSELCPSADSARAAASLCAPAAAVALLLAEAYG